MLDATTKDNPDEVYAFLVDWLRHQRPDGQRVVTTNSMLAAFANEIGHPGMTFQSGLEAIADTAGTGQFGSVHLALVEALERLVRRGLVVRLDVIHLARSVEGNKTPFPRHLLVTTHGAAALRHDQLYVTHPELAAVLRRALPDISELAVARLEDAAECLEHDLLRPCAVMLGVALEELFDQLCADLGHLFQTAPRRELLPRIQAVRGAVQARLSSGGLAVDRRWDEDWEELTALTERLRQVRNSAAHFGPVETEHARARGLFDSTLWGFEGWWAYRAALLRP